MQPWLTVYFFDIEHPCYDQLTPVKTRYPLTRYPLTSITWPYRVQLIEIMRFLKLTADQVIGSRAHVRLTCWKQGRIVRKPVNASPELKFIRIITFSCIQMFFAALFLTHSDYKTQNRKSNSQQKTSPQSYKTRVNILPFPGLAQSGTERPG